MKNIRWLGWVFIPYLFLPLQWSKMDDGQRVVGIAWAITLAILTYDMTVYEYHLKTPNQPVSEITSSTDLSQNRSFVQQNRKDPDTDDNTIQNQPKAPANVKKPELTASKPSKREQSSPTNNPVIENTPQTPNPTVTVSQAGKTIQPENQVVNQSPAEPSPSGTGKASDQAAPISDSNDQNNDLSKETTSQQSTEKPTNQTIQDLPNQVVETVAPLSKNLTHAAEDTLDSVVPEKQIVGILGK